jgi:5-methylcytosine-specific restriction endonuclease McrA
MEGDPMLNIVEVDKSLPDYKEIRAVSRRDVYNLMTLVLNADYQPRSPLMIPAREAITDFYKERIQVVDTWKDAYGNDLCFRSPSIVIPAPKVAVLNEYAAVPTHAQFNRRNVFLRDRYTCQYCGQRFPSSDLTFDHLIPRDKGGVTCWTNVVTACSPCNARKANRLPEFSGRKGTRGSGLRPLKMPVEPTSIELMRLALVFLPNEIKMSFSDWLYWHIELEP